MGIETNNPPVQIEYRDDVALVKLNRGITNPINLELVQALRKTLENAQNSSRSLVLCSSNDKFFSIGLDIPELYTLNRKDFAAFYHAFNHLQLELYTLPLPTVAAVTGHAVAGGCILALCCDYRYIADGRKLMGINEAKLGVPIPYPADCILRSIAGIRISRILTDSGEFFLPEQLYEMGVVDCVVPAKDVIPQSVEKARSLGALSQKAFAVIKRDRTEAVEKQILKRLEERETVFVECWFSDEARTQLEKQMEKF